MKYWRRHKHEFTREESDDPLPERPEKKMRYSRDDDILLAKYFFGKPEGTSDKVFQAFGRLVRFLGFSKDGRTNTYLSLFCLVYLFARYCHLDTYLYYAGGYFSIRTIHGKGGRSITGYIKRRLIILPRCWREGRVWRGKERRAFNERIRLD